jgi:hypothetical protein
MTEAPQATERLHPSGPAGDEQNKTAKEPDQAAEQPQHMQEPPLPAPQDPHPQAPPQQKPPSEPTPQPPQAGTEKEDWGIISTVGDAAERAGELGVSVLTSR